MSITAQNTVGELVAEQPSRSRIFEAFRIDYCCGGKKSLEEACATKGIAIDEVLNALERVDAQAPISENAAAMPLDVLADHIIERHHDYLRRELPRLVQMSNKVGKVHGDQDPRLMIVADEVRILTDDLMAHTNKEERILFPVIKSLARPGALPAMPFGTLANPIRAMEAEHDEAGGGLEKIAELTDDYTPPEWACNTYQALLDGLHDLALDLHVHIHKENSILFPRALEEEQRRRTAQSGN